jgi:hypothetical protein
MLYAADIEHGNLHDRVFVSLSAPECPECLWWLSVLGIYRSRAADESARMQLLPDTIENPIPATETGDAQLLHPKYHLPARCFAYVANASAPKTWKLPYCIADGEIDTKRLPKAIQSILSNYRGAKVGGIEEKAIPDVLVTLARAAVRLGKMPHQTGQTSEAYQQLAAALEQLGRLDEIKVDASHLTAQLITQGKD